MKKRKKSDKFLSGTGKFFFVLIIIYLCFYLIQQIVHTAENQAMTYYAKDIEIMGNHLVSKAEILRICGFQTRENNQIKINIDETAEKILALKYVKGVSITTRPPRVLNVTLEERHPVAFIYGRGLNLIDSEGYLMPIPGKVKLWDLPLIAGIKKSIGKLGKPSTASEAYLALEMLSYLDTNNPLLIGMISELNFSSINYMEICLMRGGATIRVNKDSFYKELYVLETFIAKYLNWAEITNIDYIDLRFKDQLILKNKT